ncbi:MAG: MarR family transcriptional regulator [Methanomicrobiales archaeon]|nr:MarR family transcriptional regulator [Methanomicrobiales archaeon]
MKSRCLDDIPLGATVSITSRGRSVFLNDRLRPLGLSAGLFPVLMLLYKEQNIMQETLVRHYRLDKGTIARAVRKLEDAGYIRRITDPGNRRAVRLFLTVKGKEAAPLLRAIDREWEERILTGLSPEEKHYVQELMHTVARNSFSGCVQERGDDFDARR